MVGTPSSQRSRRSRQSKFYELSKCAESLRTLETDECTAVVNSARAILEGLTPEEKKAMIDILGPEKMEILCKEVVGFSDVCAIGNERQLITLDREETVSFVKTASAVEEVSLIEQKMSSAEITKVGDETEKLIKEFGDEQNEWCQLNENVIIKSQVLAKQRFPTLAKEYFEKHVNLFQRATTMIQTVGKYAADLELQGQFDGFFDAAKAFCTALIRYNERLLDAKNASRLDAAYKSLEHVFKSKLEVKYNKAMIFIEGRQELDESTSIAALFGFVKWSIKYWTLIYIVGAFMYNVSVNTDILSNGPMATDILVKLFGCLCLSFAGSSYIATRLVSVAIGCVTSMISSVVKVIPVLSAIRPKSSVPGKVFNFIGTAFLTGWIKSVARITCIVITNGMALGVSGLVGVLWESISSVGSKSWTTIKQAGDWIGDVMKSNGQAMFQWFVKFTSDVVYKRFINGIVTIVKDTIATPFKTVSSFFYPGPSGLAETAKRTVKEKAKETIQQLADKAAPGNMFGPSNFGPEDMFGPENVEATQENAIQLFSTQELTKLATEHMASTDPKLYAEIGYVLPEMETRINEAMESLKKDLESIPQIIEEQLKKTTESMVKNRGFDKIISGLEATTGNTVSFSTAAQIQALREVEKAIIAKYDTTSPTPMKQSSVTRYMRQYGIVTMLMLAMVLAYITRL